MEWFFKDNVKHDMEMKIVWDTSKVFFRGIAIKQNAIRNAKNN